MNLLLRLKVVGPSWQQDPNPNGMQDPVLPPQLPVGHERPIMMYLGEQLQKACPAAHPVALQQLLEHWLSVVFTTGKMLAARAVKLSQDPLLQNWRDAELKVWEHRPGPWPCVSQTCA